MAQKIKNDTTESAMNRIIELNPNGDAYLDQKIKKESLKLKPITLGDTCAVNEREFNRRTLK